MGLGKKIGKNTAEILGVPYSEGMTISTIIDTEVKDQMDAIIESSIVNADPNKQWIAESSQKEDVGK